MRKMLVLVCLVAISAIAYAGKDKSITVNQLPTNSQTFIKQHFAKMEISYAKMETDFLEKSYEVVMVNGDKIEFSKDGEWKEVNCKYSSVPELIVPQAIKDYIKSNHKELKVLQIDKDNRGYEVELGNGIELYFNKQLKFVGYDR